MKILQINSVCGIRSTGRICTDIAKTLEQNGHECKIAYGRENVPDEFKKYAVKIGTDTDVTVNALQARLLDNDGFGLKGPTKRLIKWIKEYNPDVIHLHNLHGYYINVEILFNFLKSSGKPVVWTLHDCWAFTGHCAYFSYACCDKWKDGCADCSQKTKYPSSILVDNSNKNYKSKESLFCGVDNMTLVTPSKWLSDLVKQSYLKDYPVKVINNGIDIRLFKSTPSDFRERYGLQGKRIILGVASFFSKTKGYDDFLKLSSMLNDDYKIVLVGVSDKQIKELPDSILAIQKTNSVEQLAKIYTAADVFFNPTYEDNYPTVNLEAQACGTPVITYRTGGSVESVPCENIVEQGDLKKVTDILNCQSLSVLSASRFDKNKFYGGYLDLYFQLK